MDATEQISGLLEPRTAVFRPRRDEDEGRAEEATPAVGVPEPIRAPELAPRKFQARLNYDPVEEDVFIEILDPKTGEVLRRLPAEDASEDETAGQTGALLDRVA
ncbi:MAG: hypothetical protein ACPGQ5_02465 [Alphaproteobacteria bacterium]